jgi:acyl-CoA synthetase (AMP-forming)/AMP-acid ligase II
MITDLLVEQAIKHPGRPFVVTDAGTYSFADILVATQKFARCLLDQGIGKGDHVALLAENSAAYLVVMFGIVWIGAIPVALNNGLVGESLCYALEQSDSKLIVADEAWISDKRGHLNDSLRLLPHLVIEDDTKFMKWIEGYQDADPVRVPNSNTCMILYTSGTTGLPKGVMNSHDCYTAAGRDTVECLELTSDDRIMVFLPLFHANPQMYAVMSALTVGAALIVLRRFSATDFFEEARRFAATGLTFVGTILSILSVRHPGIDKDHSLRFAVGGGAPKEVWQNVHDRFGFRVHELYGMTEIGGWVSSNSVKNYRFGSCGSIRKCMDVRIFDEDDREVARGTAGEIVVRPIEPDVILSGYYKKPEEMVSRSRNFWYHTGDRGSIDADGFLYFHGRSTELIRRGGEMISPVEIETKLRAMPGILDCAIVGIADNVMGEEIKAVVVFEEPTDHRMVATYLRTHFPPHMIPRYVEFASVIPKTETQKIQRHKLQYINASVHDLRN